MNAHNNLITMLVAAAIPWTLWSSLDMHEEFNVQGRDNYQSKVVVATYLSSGHISWSLTHCVPLCQTNASVWQML